MTTEEKLEQLQEQYLELLKIVNRLQHAVMRLQQMAIEDAK